jgi:hypothetical protein
MIPSKIRENSPTPNLPTINCDCGHKILLIPDLKSMGHAIEEHVLDHKNKFFLTDEKAEALENSLIAQALELVVSSQKKRMEL